ncbi:MAG: FxsA family protein [Desulfovibrionales bacterium]|nr:FxsA family protein [Desulfovibrionales bacterium]
MKHILTDDERRFLLGPLPSDKKNARQLEYLEGGKAILRALKTLYPEQPITYVALFLTLSTFALLEINFNSTHNAAYLFFVSAVLSNIVGLFVLRRNDTGWIDRGLAIIQAREIPTQETFRHIVVTLSATLFIVPGLLFSIVGLLILVTPLKNTLASLLQTTIEKKFRSL